MVPVAMDLQAGFRSQTKANTHQDGPTSRHSTYLHMYTNTNTQTTHKHTHKHTTTHTHNNTHTHTTHTSNDSERPTC